MYLFYHQASVAQQEQAFRTVQSVLQTRFPTVSLEELQQAFTLGEPELSVSENELRLEYYSMVRIVNYLAANYITSPEELDPPIYGPITHYVSKKLNSLQRTAAWATEHHEGETTPAAAAFYLSVLAKLATEDVTASQVEQAFIIPASDTQPQKVLVEAMPFPEPGGVSPFGPEALLAEWKHLREWIEQRHDPLRPWNIAARNQASQMPQSVVTKLLFEPLPTSEEKLAHFTRERLRRFQRLLKPYGYFYSPAAESPQ